MNRRMLLGAMLGLTPALLAQGKGKGHGKGHGKGNPHDDYEDRGARGGADLRYFRAEDYGPIERFYNGPRNLPPGLRKKYYRTGTLPPGWQKKLQPFPPQLVRVLPPLPPAYGYGYADGVAIVYDRKTRIILDSIDLISAIAGH